MKFVLNKKIRSRLNEEQKKLEDENIIERIWQKDYTIWSDSSDEITNRLGWLDSLDTTTNSINDIDNFVNEIIRDGLELVILLGMGGSSLAPEVFRKIFGVKKGFLDLKVVDSTHPDFIKETTEEIDFKKTLFLVSTKSGGTVETISFMKHFFNKCADALGINNTGKHFAAITDPGSGLENIARNLNFRKIILNDPNIGGRYSALSLFGMVPAALVGVDLNLLLSRAKSVVSKSKTPDSNPATELGLIMGISALEGLDKLTFITSPELNSFGAWVEQLIAESTGKNGKGILPVNLEEIISAEKYSKDRIFIHIKLNKENEYEDTVGLLTNAGFNIITIELEDIFDLGVEFFRWEFATIIAGWLLKIQPFDQPNVESAKVVAREMMDDYKESGSLPSPSPIFTENNIKVYSNLTSKNIRELLTELLDKIVENKSYVAIQTYIKPGYNADELLHTFRTIIQKKYKVATTVGYGPRFLHSTGQLHKGDAGNGLFIQIIDEPLNDVPIPDNAGEDKSSVSFGTLIKAQAFGDRKALIDNNRNVITFDIGRDAEGGIKELTKALNN